MRTETDDLLSWPFTKRVTVTLLDQSDDVRKRRPITAVIDPTTEPAAVVSRPRDRGPTFGIKNFIRLEKLHLSQAYIYNDTLYLNVQFEE